MILKLKSKIIIFTLLLVASLAIGLTTSAIIDHTKKIELTITNQAVHNTELITDLISTDMGDDETV